ncbi:MAG: class I SAM-dependent methyltransferase [Chlamydiota bacterium]
MQNPSEFVPVCPSFWESVRLFARALWVTFLREDSHVIDATCGKGRDTLFLAKCVPQGHVYSYDIQSTALAEAKRLIDGEGKSKQVTFFHQSHTSFEQNADLVVYNLGYLPGSDKTICTQPKDVLESVEHAQSFAQAICITCYPGHLSGRKEEELLHAYSKTLDAKLWTASHHRWVNRHLCPSLIWLTKINRR